MFRLKKWLWTKLTELRGPDRAYANYLAHFKHYQENVADKTLQQDLNVKPMSKEAFLKAWNKPATKSSCKPGCCG